MSAVKRVEFVSDKMSYIHDTKRLLVLNVHTQTQDKFDYVKDSFSEELECVFDKFINI
jgi:hypothetical protein